jgi:uncharacterized coiled-coil protein SlyX
MSQSLEQIETKIAWLEQANAQLSDVVIQQRRELEALHAKLEELLGRFAAEQEAPTVYSPEDEKPPHY